MFFIDMHWQVPSRIHEKSFELKQVAERVNFIRARACLLKVVYKDELIEFQC